MNQINDNDILTSITYQYQNIKLVFKYTNFYNKFITDKKIVS